jgi:branched-chain amino acid aminotransferase
MPMSINPSDYVWHNGQLIPWDEAHIHVMAHVVNYGSSMFEGIRCYHTPKGPAIFRLRDHMQRLIHSAKVYRIELDYTLDELCQAAVELVAANKVSPCYVRPIVLRGYGQVGVNPFNSPTEVYIANYEWGKYLGSPDCDDGVDVCVSSWTRLAPNTMPTMAKAGANYMNSQLIKMEAIVNGYEEGIALDVNGYVSEGSGENIFVVKNGSVSTPPLANSALPGITRDSIMKLCQDQGIPVAEQMLPREMLYIADEVFFCGTAAEVTPVRSVDRIKIGSGARGPITKRLQDEFFSIVNGKAPDRHGWLSPLNVPSAAIR